MNKCKCTPDETTGWTEVKCCNICGKPVEDFWDVPDEKIYTTDEVWDLYRNDKDFFFTSFSDFAKSNGFVFIKQLKR